MSRGGWIWVREIRGKASWREKLPDVVLDAWMKSLEACGSYSRMGGWDRGSPVSKDRQTDGVFS